MVPESWVVMYNNRLMDAKLGTDGMLLFGGSFNPIHHIHLEMGYEVGKRIGVREVLFIPNYQSPCKDEPILISPEERFTTLFNELNRFQDLHTPPPFLSVSQVELQKKKPVYTIETLQELKQIDPNCHLLIGLDQFELFPEWKAYREILDLCHLCVVHRSNATFPKQAKFLKSVDTIEDHYLFEDTHIIRYFKLPFDDRSSKVIRHLVQAKQWKHPWIQHYLPDTIDVLKRWFK